MNAGEIITAYQNSQDPPLKDADLARSWDTHPSNVLRIKRGKQMPGNKIWPNIRKSAPELYDNLQKFYFGEPLESPHATQDRAGGVFRRLVRIFTGGKQ